MRVSARVAILAMTKPLIMGKRHPNRATTHPEAKAATIIAPFMGKKHIPVVTAEYPRTFCKKILRIKNKPPEVKNTKA